MHARASCACVCRRLQVACGSNIQKIRNCSMPLALSIQEIMSHVKAVF